VTPSAAAPDPAADRPVLVERRDSTLLITIDRPGVKNALDLAVAEGIAAALDELDADPALKIGVLTGAGGNFSSGMDLKAFAAGQKPVIPGRGLAGFAEAPPAKPLIAAVEGYALAGGFEVALACDLIVASREATFGLPEVRRGLLAAGGGLVRLPRLLPPPRSSSPASSSAPSGWPSTASSVD
jgi:enoyl-CoA hydratase